MCLRRFWTGVSQGEKLAKRILEEFVVKIDVSFARLKDCFNGREDWLGRMRRMGSRRVFSIDN